MSSRLSLRVLAIFVLFTLIIPLAMVIANEVYGDGDGELATPSRKRPEQKYPNLGSSLNQLVARVEARGQLLG